jgi:hypothetical protein
VQPLFNGSSGESRGIEALGLRQLKLMSEVCVSAFCAYTLCICVRYGGGTCRKALACTAS